MIPGPHSVIFLVAGWHSGHLGPHCFLAIWLLIGLYFIDLWTIKRHLMNEFILLFRLDILTKEMQPSPEQLEIYMKQYHDWVGGIAAQNKFVGGKGLSTEGKVLKSNNVITDGPFAEIKESIAGYIVIRAADFEEAVNLTRACPILNGEGNSVEIRMITGVHDNNQ
jgi:hypothetical protein